jgi:hypothetical protein
MSFPRASEPYHFQANLFWWDGPVNIHDNSKDYFLTKKSVFYKFNSKNIFWKNIKIESDLS